MPHPAETTQADLAQKAKALLNCIKPLKRFLGPGFVLRE
ncbi:hypothetical protein LzC2_04010 [Planctomycetes bacterium LzC2]|uniref:Uncharacterized protein n=1 Tax=Alienimonas chondri TaxID=2681879 RepID=A0ABX1V8I5_9PLAN|nr:hypothetical protein [Alienimonas chondri]